MIARSRQSIYWINDQPVEQSLSKLAIEIDLLVSGKIDREPLQDFQ